MAARYEQLEEAIEEALFAEADRVVLAGDGIHRIRAGVESAAARRDRQWWRRVLRRWINPVPAGATAGTGHHRKDYS